MSGPQNFVPAMYGTGGDPIDDDLMDELKKRAASPATRKAAERARHKAAGRVAVTLWVRPEWRVFLRRIEARIRGREAK